MGQRLRPKHDIEPLQRCSHRDLSPGDLRRDCTVAKEKCRHQEQQEQQEEKSLGQKEKKEEKEEKEDKHEQCLWGNQGCRDSKRAGCRRWWHRYIPPSRHE